MLITAIQIEIASLLALVDHHIVIDHVINIDHIDLLIV